MATSRRYAQAEVINGELFGSCQQLKKQIVILKKETQRLTAEIKGLIDSFPEMKDMILADLAICQKALSQFRDCLNKLNTKNILAALVKQAPYLIEKTQDIINALSNLANTIITIYQKFCVMKGKMTPEINRTMKVAKQTYEDLCAVRDQITPLFEMAYEIIEALMTSIGKNVKTFGNSLKEPKKKIVYLIKGKKPSITVGRRKR